MTQHHRGTGNATAPTVPHTGNDGARHHLTAGNDAGRTVDADERRRSTSSGQRRHMDMARGQPPDEPDPFG